MFLDGELDFDEHIKEIVDKTSKFVDLIVKFGNFLPRLSLLQIYKSFARPYSDYSDNIFDIALIGSFQKKLESVQYNAALPITWTIKGNSKE